MCVLQVRAGDPYFGFCARCREKRSLSLSRARFLSVGLAAPYSSAPYDPKSAAAAAASRPRQKKQKAHDHGLLTGSPLP